MSRKALFLQQAAFDDSLCCDSRVIGPGHPQDIVSLHALESDQDILKCIVQCMPQMQCASDIWRGHDNRIGFAIGVRLGVKIAL